LAVSGANYPGESKETSIHVSDGISLLPALKGDKLARKSPLFYQFSKSAAVRDGEWKLVRLGPNWELYNMNKDRTETNDLIAQQPDIAKKMEVQWLAWWKDCTKTEWTGKAPKEFKDE
jgi:arylsulfatase